ncbi:hypothetical protein [Ohtaekwangia sp.]|uniref:hypothetical protein n=1 Tax=Ohtaekwangia sp. TaxID=2066019 RepID=UPI002F928ED1
MKTESDEYKVTGMDMVIKYFGLIMAVAYIGIGAAVITRPDIINIHGPYALPLGILLIAYGLFRAFKVYQRYFQK